MVAAMEVRRGSPRKRRQSAVGDLFEFLLPIVNVSYLDGKGNLEPQGTGRMNYPALTRVTAAVGEMKGLCHLSVTC